MMGRHGLAAGKVGPCIRSFFWQRLEEGEWVVVGDLRDGMAVKGLRRDKSGHTRDRGGVRRDTALPQASSLSPAAQFARIAHLPSKAVS